MEKIVIFIIIFTMIMILISTYRDVKKDQNKKLIKNMNAYAEKEKIKQQESKILGRKQIKSKDGKKKRTRMYHL
tara:strand:+ start:317 stop:538 length:222 start_codon:yes stop_codon:yes gene_type:complete